MTIHLLPEEVAARIAAGEVVERPASVVKELVENSLDAGATHIEVETQQGGIELIRVRDNGAGIALDEVLLAFRRHSTSKLETALDLEHIATLGFRGEALSSIASVSRITCITRARDEAVGTQVRIEGGSVTAQMPVGRPPGTELVIRDLFYNVPARLKFLHSERTERRHVDAFLTRYAIAYPGTAFRLVHDGREILVTAGRGDNREALLAVYGMDLGASLLQIPADLTAESAVQVHGFVGPTTVHRADRGYITVFVNGRWIQDLRLTYAIIQAYHTLLPVNRFPVAFVMIRMPPEDVDVNVHPAKAEVRFRDSDAAFRAVQRAVRATVVEQAPAVASWRPPLPESPEPSDEEAQSTRARLAALRPAPQQIAFPDERVTGGRRSSDGALWNQFVAPEGNRREQIAGEAARLTTQRQNLPPLRIIGQASTLFIIAEGPDGLYLIDQHAAHERVLYEAMLAAWVRGEVPAQPLLEPAVVTLPADQAADLDAMIPALARLGMDVEPFGPSTYLVRSVPALLGAVSAADLLADVAASKEGTESPIRIGLEEILVRTICKRAAVKAGQVLSQEEMARLVKDLERTESPRTCPHGRPIIVQIGLDSLIRQFGRPG